MAGTTGLEPATSAVTGQRSNQTELRPQNESGNLFFSHSPASWPDLRGTFAAPKTYLGQQFHNTIECIRKTSRRAEAQSRSFSHDSHVFRLGRPSCDGTIIAGSGGKAHVHGYAAHTLQEVVRDRRKLLRGHAKRRPGYADCCYGLALRIEQRNGDATEAFLEFLVVDGITTTASLLDFSA